MKKIFLSVLAIALSCLQPATTAEQKMNKKVTI